MGRGSWVGLKVGVRVGFGVSVREGMGRMGVKAGESVAVTGLLGEGDVEADDDVHPASHRNANSSPKKIAELFEVLLFIEEASF